MYVPSYQALARSPCKRPPHRPATPAETSAPVRKIPGLAYRSCGFTSNPQGTAIAHVADVHTKCEAADAGTLRDLLQHFASARTIAVEDLDLLLVTDRVDAALDHIRRHAVERFGLVPRAVRPSRLLGERAVAQVRQDSWAHGRFTQGRDYAA